MNAKKISALVLAAVMAAGTTTVAFARANEDYPLDIPDRQWENVYVEKDGVLKEVQKGDIVTPGTTLYIRLNEAPEAETKDKNKSKVWAEWKVGKDMVEDIDIVYKKGEFYTGLHNSDVTFTIDGVDFTVNGVNSMTDTQLASAIEKKLTDYQAKHKDFLEDEIRKEYFNYVNRGGYEVGKKYYADAESALVANGFIKGDFYNQSGVALYNSTDDVSAFTSRNSESGAGATFYIDPSDYAKGYGEVYYSADGPQPANTEEKSATDWTRVTIDGKKYGIDTTKIKTIADLAAAGCGELVAKSYRDADFVGYTKDEALKACGAVEVRGSIADANGTVITSSDAYKKAVATVIYTKAQDIVAEHEFDLDMDDEYTYWVAIDTKDDDTTALLDLAGSIYVGTTKSKAYDANAYDLDFTFSNRVDDYSDADVVEDEYTFKPDSRAVVKFAKDAEDVTLYFGSEEDIWYEFDARGQSALNFAFTFDYNREIAADYPEANIDFITWTAQPSTNRTGTLYITADPDSFIYEISEDGKTLKEVANAEYNEDEEAWEIRTRKLVGYAISDKELDLVEDTTSSSTGSETGSNNGGKDNPDTGR